MDKYDQKTAKKYLSRSTGLLKTYFHHQEETIVFERLEPEGRVVLDLGCGVGRLEEELVAKKAKQIIACDLSEDMLRIARDHHDLPNVYYLAMDAQSLAIKDNSIDIVIALGMFEGIEELMPFILEVHRVLKQGGKFTFTCWNANRWYRLPFFDGRRPGSVDHDIQFIVDVLNNASMKTLSVKTAFYLPRRIFWGIYKLLIIPAFRKIFIEVCNAASVRLKEYHSMKDRGWLLVVTAEKT